jgi:uncharacterized protein (TIGR02246 family)
LRSSVSLMVVVLSLALLCPALAVAADAQSFDGEVGQLLSQLQAAWAAGDGTAYAAAFAEEADFVPFFGIHLHGRQAIAGAHQGAFDTALKGTRLWLKVESIRPIADGVVVVHTVGAVIDPGSEATDPKPTSRQSFVLVRRDGGLVVEAFQNTVIQPPPGAPPAGGR